jgi:hypothetical protein
VEWKFSHQCSEFEGLSANRMHTLDLAAHPDGRDTLDVWWDDDVPANVTSQDMDVIFRVRAGDLDPPFGAGDSLGVIGSEAPLSWDLPPLVRLLDDGVAPDDVANDGTFSGRVTYPAGTYRSLLYRFVHRAAADSVFRPECEVLPYRAADLDDTQYSTGNPLILDRVFDDCLNATGVRDAARIAPVALLSLPRPNPARGATTLSLSLPARSHAAVTVHDVRGRVVRRLLDGVLEAGVHQVTWDGRTDQGYPAASGVYFFRAATGEGSPTRRVVRTR